MKAYREQLDKIQPRETAFAMPLAIKKKGLADRAGYIAYQVANCCGIEPRFVRYVFSPCSRPGKTCPYQGDPLRYSCSKCNAKYTQEEWNAGHVLEEGDMAQVDKYIANIPTTCLGVPIHHQ